MTDLFDDPTRAALALRINGWLSAMRVENPAIEAVDRDEGDEPRWFVRMRGEAKEFTTVWLTLGQRTLRYETYVMPAPEEQAVELYEHVLRLNDRLVGAHFSIGVEDAIFLRGEMLLSSLTEPELDRVIGTLYAHAEQAFPTLIRFGFPRFFRD